MSVANPRDGEDEIEASRAPLIEHLVELRSRLIKSLIAFLVMFFLCFALATQIYNILVQPYIWAAGPGANVQLIYTAPLEYLFTQIKKELIDLIRDNKDAAEQALDLMMITKYLERIGDHAVNVAEWVVFSITGQHVKGKVKVGE